MNEKQIAHETKVLKITLIVCPVVTILWVFIFPQVVRVVFNMFY